MLVKTFSTLSFCLVGLLTGAANGQTFTRLIAEGDLVPGGRPGEVISRIEAVDVNGSGDWAAVLDGDGTADGDCYAIVNGAIVFQEGTSTGIPSPGTRMTSRIDRVDLNSGGDRLFLVRTLDSSLAPGMQTGSALIRNGVQLYQEGLTLCSAPGPAFGLVYTELSACWQNDNNQLLVGGRVGSLGDEILITVELDPVLGTVLSETMLALEKETLLGHGSPVQGVSFGKGRNAINNSGDVLWFVDDEHTDPGGDCRSDSNFYFNTTLLYNEGDAFPTTALETFDSLDLAEVDLNNNGDFVFSGFDRRPETEDLWIFKSIGGVISVLAHEGDPVPASVGGPWVTKGFGFGGQVSLSDDGDVLWFLDWNDPDTSKDTGLLFNDTLIMQEGVTLLDGSVVLAVPSDESSVALSDDGSKAITKVVLAGEVEAVYLIENMHPSAFDTFCDPGLANSTGETTELEGYFLTGGGISGGMSDLHLECSDGPPGQLGYFLTGADAVEPGTMIGDGLLCLVGGSGPFFRYAVGGTNAFSIGFFNASGVLENVVGTSSVGPVGLETGFDVPDSIPGTSQVITAGSTWHFQVWHRDTALGSSHSNFSNGFSVSF